MGLRHRKELPENAKISKESKLQWVSIHNFAFWRLSSKILGVLFCAAKGQWLTAQSCSFTISGASFHQHQYHAGDDQMGALDFRASICALRRHAGGRRLAHGCSTWLDCCLHGLG